LINAEEMYKFANIESLIDREITKLNIPESIGISPEWSTKRGPRVGGFSRHGKSQGGGNSRPKTFHKSGNGDRKPFVKKDRKSNP
jgi:ATP-dependent RNA helicase RhlE